MIGNNSCGTHSRSVGKRSTNVEELRILLYDGSQMTVRAATEAELAEIIGQRGRRGRDLQQLHTIRRTIRA